MTDLVARAAPAQHGRTEVGRTEATGAGARIASLDVVRGAVMVLMALDHVRIFAGVPAGGATAGLFLTRWITHFCAPAFIFLAGTSAYLYGRRHGGLSRFLFVRGAWLVLLELTVIRLSWTFNLDFGGYLLAGVIWAIGWCMIAMAVLVRLPAWSVGALGIAIIAGHNLLDGSALLPALAESPLSGAWKILYLGFFVGPVQLAPDGPPLVVLYSLVPWIGVMAAGYAFGAVVVAPAARRRRLCLGIGLSAVALFLLLRGFNLYGDPVPWGTGEDGLPPLFSFLNTAKYPASLAFLLMTLGPVIALLPALERATGPVARGLTVFGRVPLFYYLLHIPLIHLLAIAVSAARLGEVSPWLFANHPMGSPPPPEGYRWSLPLLYAVWIATVALLHPACRWFADLKTRRGDAWLRYL